jgi:hypothetical protein
MYIATNPSEVSAFLDYHRVHQRKVLTLAQSVGVDLTEIVTPEERARIEDAYQAVKDQYQQVVCAKCGTKRTLASWTKKDTVTLARDVGLGPAVLGPYFLPTLHIHTTPTRLTSRLQETTTGLSFKAGPQRKQADAVTASAHVCVVLILELQNRYFGLGLDIEALQRDLQHCLANRYQRHSRGSVSRRCGAHR